MTRCQHIIKGASFAALMLTSPLGLPEKLAAGGKEKKSD